MGPVVVEITINPPGGGYLGDFAATVSLTAVPTKGRGWARTSVGPADRAGRSALFQLP